MSKHTPGPWEVDHQSIVATNGFSVADVWTPPGHNNTAPQPTPQAIERQANARLIAAAPEMYELLRYATLNYKAIIARLQLEKEDAEERGEDCYILATAHAELGHDLPKIAALLARIDGEESEV